MTLTIDQVPDCIITCAIAQFLKPNPARLILSHSTIEPDGRKRRATVRALRVAGYIESDDVTRYGETCAVVAQDVVWSELRNRAGRDFAPPNLVAHVLDGKGDVGGAVAVSDWRVRAIVEGRERPEVSFWRLTQAEQIHVLTYPEDYRLVWVKDKAKDVEWKPGQPLPEDAAAGRYGRSDEHYMLYVSSEALDAKVGDAVRTYKRKQLLDRNMAAALPAIVPGVDEVAADRFMGAAAGPFRTGATPMFEGSPSTWTAQADRILTGARDKFERALATLIACERVVASVTAFGGWEKYGEELIARIDRHLDKPDDDNEDDADGVVH